MNPPNTGSINAINPHGIPVPSQNPPMRFPPATALQQAGLLALLVGTGVLYLWNLGANGWANAYYAAAIQAGANNWTAFLFGSFDQSNAITVDKPPAFLWIPAISVKIFGLNTYSILIPEVLMGVAAVFLLYAAITRVAGRTAGLIAGLALALTPVALLMFRYNNPEATLILLMCAAAYSLVRALQSTAGRALLWMILLGVLLGLGFLTKQLQVFTVVPAFPIAYFFTANTGWLKRIGHLVAAGVAMLVAAGWWVLLIQLTPAASRPYVGGSQNNSFLQLTFGYNGLGRINGYEVGAVGSGRRSGWSMLRMFTGNFATQISWLLPAALIILVAALWFLLRTKAWKYSPERQILGLTLALGLWLVLTTAVFSFMRGTIHTYYTDALSPAIAGLIGLGTAILWRHRSSLVALTALAGSILITGSWAMILVSHDPGFIDEYGQQIFGLAILAAMLVLLSAWSFGHEGIARVLVPIAAAVSLVAVLAAPAAYSVATVQGSRTGALIVAGPVAQPINAAGSGGGLLHVTTPGPTVIDMLRSQASIYRWVAATTGSNDAAGYQLESRAPVLAVGGFNGTDPFPTLAQFQHYVSTGQIHYWIDGHLYLETTGGSRTAFEIRSWIHANFEPIRIDGAVLYDLSPAAGKAMIP